MYNMDSLKTDLCRLDRHFFYTCWRCPKVRFLWENVSKSLDNSKGRTVPCDPFYWFDCVRHQLLQCFFFFYVRRLRANITYWFTISSVMGSWTLWASGLKHPFTCKTFCISLSYTLERDQQNFYILNLRVREMQWFSSVCEFPIPCKDDSQ